MSMDTTHRIVFQGGTALRLCYGNTRFSEDLDFVMNQRSLPYSLSEPILPFHQIVEQMRPMLPHPSNITWKIQKATPTLQRTVLTAQLPDSTNVRLHLEFVTVPSYDPRILTLSSLRDSQPIVVESREEILADKIVALGLRPYIKGRDIWDVAFLQASHVPVHVDWILQKVQDYGAQSLVFYQNLVQRRQILQNPETLMQFRQELSRFIAPQQVATLDSQQAWAQMTQQCVDMIQNTTAHFTGPRRGGPHR